MQTVDFTVREAGQSSRGSRVIATCPKCDRNGEKRRATLGATVYTHTAEVVIPGVENGLKAIDYCRVEK